MVREGWVWVVEAQCSGIFKLPRNEHLKSESLDSRNGHMEKRTINTLIIRWDVLYLIAYIYVLAAMVNKIGKTKNNE